MPVRGGPLQSQIDRVSDRRSAELGLGLTKGLFVQVDQVLCHTLKYIRRQARIYLGSDCTDQELRGAPRRAADAEKWSR